MRCLNEQQVQSHVAIAGWLLVAYCALNLIGGLVASALVMLGGVFFTQLGPAVNDAEATRIFAVLSSLTALTAGLIAVLTIGLALPALIAGIGLLRRKTWARIFSVIVSVFTLMVFPVGTFIGLYVIFVALQDAAEAYFTQPSMRAQVAPQPG